MPSPSPSPSPSPGTTKKAIAMGEGEGDRVVPGLVKAIDQNGEGETIVIVWFQGGSRLGEGHGEGEGELERGS